MPTARDELVAEYLSQIYAHPDSDWKIITLRDKDGTHVTATGTAAEGRLFPQHTYRFFGPGFTNHPKYGRQFNFTDFVEHTPHSRRSIIAYLSKLEGVGNATANCLYDLFKDECIGKLRQDPEGVVAAVKAVNKRLPFGIDKAKAAAKTLKQKANLEAARLDMIDLFEGRGFPGTTIEACIKQLGPQAPLRIRRDPFILLSKQFPGAGFLRVDRMYQELGLPLDRRKRVVYLLWHTVTKNRRGDTWMTKSELFDAVSAALEVKSVDDLEKALRMGRLAGVLSEGSYDGFIHGKDRFEGKLQPMTQGLVSLAQWERQEEEVAENVLRIVRAEGESEAAA